MRRITLFLFLLILLAVPSLAQQADDTALAVTQFFPSSETIAEVNSKIVVLFNRPVVPLVTSADQDTLPDPLVISPSVEGTGEWVNTSIYQFTPTVGLVGGINYSVTIPANSLTAVDGTTLAADSTFVFTTAAPIINTISPEVDEFNVRLDTPIVITFSQAVDRASVEREFYLRAEGETASQIDGEFFWDNDDREVRFVPSVKLELDTPYVYGFDAAIQSAGGGNVDTAGLPSIFRTVPLPTVIGTTPLDGSFDLAPSGYGDYVTINFVSPMNPETLEGKVTVDPAPEFEPTTYYSDYNYSYSVNFRFEPQTTYTITLAAGAEDVYGNGISAPFTFSFTTGNTSAVLAVRTPGVVGLYNPAREDVGFYVAYRNITDFSAETFEVPVDALLQYINENNYYSGVSYYDPVGSYPQIGRRIYSNEAPANAYRFQFISLNEMMGGEVATCAGAPASRVKVGDQVRVVTTDGDPLRARSTPPDGEIVELLYKDYAMSILEGPVCANGLQWWRVQLRNDLQGWVAEGSTDEYFIEPNTIPPTQTPITDGSTAVEAGIYYVRLHTEVPQFGPATQGHFMVVTNASLTVKSSLDTTVVWATDLQTGAPLSNLTLTLYTQGKSDVVTATTDEQGVATFAAPLVRNLYENRTVVVDDGTYFGFSTSSMGEGINPYLFGISSNFYPNVYRATVYTDRPIYRPGQTVNFKGILRQQDDMRYLLPEATTVQVIASDYSGNTLIETELPVNDYGTFNGSIELSEDVAVGTVYLSVNIFVEGQEYAESTGTSFSIAEFRTPEFTVEATSPTTEVADGDTITVNINSTYFFGGPVSNAQLRYTVTSYGRTFDYEGEGYYSFSNYDYYGTDNFYDDQFYGDIVTTGIVTTNGAGEATIEVPAALLNENRDARWEIEGYVNDEANQPISGRTSVVVHQGEVYVGVRPTSYVSEAQQPTTLEFITVDWDSQAVANQEVKVRVVQLNWSSVQEQSSDGSTVWKSVVEEVTVVEETTLTTDGEGKTTLEFTPPQPGTYRVYATTTDNDGNQVISSTYVWVTGGEYVAWRQENNKRVELIADKDEYAIGDTAEILITSPFQGTTQALVTIERGDTLLYDLVTLESNSQVYTLPILDTYAPNVYVSVFLVKGVDENTKVADFRMGYVELAVDRSRKEITVQIEKTATDGAILSTALPDQSVTYTITTTDYTGAGVQSEISVQMVDKAVLAVLTDNTPALMDVFYSQQSLSVITGTLLAYNADLLTQEILDVFKGGGGGGGDGGGVLDVRNELEDAPYWNATLLTDENGVATFEVTLPDNLTTWVVKARAITKAEDGELLVGEQKDELLSTKPLIVRPVTPRFFTLGDQVTLGAVVNNNTEADLTVDVRINATGVEFDLATETQTVTVPAQGRAEVNWDVTVTDASAVNAIFSAESGQYADATISPVSINNEGLLNVYKYEVPEFVGTSGVLATPSIAQESIVLPQSEQGQLDIRVDRSLAGVSLQALRAFENDDTDCVECTISKMLANLVTYNAFVTAGLQDDTLRNALNDEVAIALQRLSADQKADGGWGWFGSVNSDVLTTTYALLGLSLAREAGYPVSDTLTDGAYNFVTANFITPELNTPQFQLNRQAFMLYVLAKIGLPDTGRTAALAEVSPRLALFAKAWLAQALMLINPDDARAANLVNELVSAATISATGAKWQEEQRDYWNWNTDVRTSAIVLQTLVMAKVDPALLSNGVRGLIVLRRASGWQTLQETTFSIWALTDYALSTGELQPTYDFMVALNDAEVLQGNATPENVTESETATIPVTDLNTGEANSMSIERGDGAGVLYYSAQLQAFLPVAEVEEYASGIFVSRRYTLLGSDEPITSAKVGDIIQVRLTVIAPNNLNYVVIEDPLPAGAEAIDPSLITSQQQGTQPELNPADPLTSGFGWWLFDSIQFRTQKVILSSTNLPQGTYEYVYTMRATIPGVYNVIPTTGREFYFPDVYGRSNGLTFTITGE